MRVVSSLTAGKVKLVECCRAQRDFLQRKVFEKEGTLADAKADRKESERDRKIHEAIANLKRLFPGVHSCLSKSFAQANPFSPMFPFACHPAAQKHQWYTFFLVE